MGRTLMTLIETTGGYRCNVFTFPGDGPCLVGTDESSREKAIKTTAKRLRLFYGRKVEEIAGRIIEGL